ncbi:hypothetical protein J437_LFUL016974 [Ladona fulva]|uniref:Protein-serine/threonine kinase n=1 Tax=Ladona fulva TaxID=123851 RepID=A0A8K0KLH2_LADFU|nr:hypothetical protein J437_LFUL016974 [Ladona fulva]
MLMSNLGTQDLLRTVITLNFYISVYFCVIVCLSDTVLEHGVPIQTVYVPSHLYHMLFELFKNSMRAVVENHSPADEDQIPSPEDLPPLEVLVVRGREDISVKVSDLGGGIARSEIDLLFNYMYSTAPQPSKSGSHTVPLAGYGYGLPISRLYARYFHGDLILTSCEGYGTDAVIYMKEITGQQIKHFQMKQMNCYQYSTRLLVVIIVLQFQLVIGATKMQGCMEDK